MISAMQALLARTMLNMSQQDVAQRLGWAHQTLSKIENGTVNPPASRLKELEDFYENAGVEFLDRDGVRKKTKSVITYEGRDGFAQFRKDVLNAAMMGQADICVSDVNDRLFDKWGEGEVNNNYRKTMAELPYKQCRILSRKNDAHFPATGFAEYRWIPENEFSDFPFYIYSTKTAMIAFEEDHLFIFVIDHPMITAFYRRNFNERWNKALIPTRA